MGLIRLLKRDLAKEAECWVAEELITAPQAEAICDRYGIDFHNPAKKSFGLAVLTSLGYLFLGLAVITLMAANWEDIPRGVRMGGLFSITLAAHAMGLVRLHQGRTNAAAGCFFLGSLFYGGAIMLIAQIYHVGEHFPDGIFVWALGVLPLGLLLKSRILMLLTAVLGFIWFFTESSLGYFPWAFPVFLAGVAAHLFWGRPSRILFMVLVTGCGVFMTYGVAWWIGSNRHFMWEADLVALGAMFFIFCYGLAAFLMSRPEIDLADYGTLLSLWTLRFFMVALFVLSFEEPWESLLEADWQLAVPMAVLAPVFTGAGLWLSHRAGTSMAAPVFVCLVFLALMFYLMSGSQALPAVGLQVVDNLFLVMAGVWLIVQGIRRGVSHYFFLGVVSLLAMGLIRYLDLVGDYVGAAALFTGFSLVLLGTARFWKLHNTKNGGTP